MRKFIADLLCKLKLHRYKVYAQMHDKYIGPLGWKYACKHCGYVKYIHRDLGGW